MISLELILLLKCKHLAKQETFLFAVIVVSLPCTQVSRPAVYSPCMCHLTITSYIIIKCACVIATAGKRTLSLTFCHLVPWHVALSLCPTPTLQT